jgi:hypothetical protein
MRANTSIVVGKYRSWAAKRRLPHPLVSSQLRGIVKACALRRRRCVSSNARFGSNSCRRRCLKSRVRKRALRPGRGTVRDPNLRHHNRSGRLARCRQGILKLTLTCLRSRQVWVLIMIECRCLIDLSGNWVRNVHRPCAFDSDLPSSRTSDRARTATASAALPCPSP